MESASRSLPGAHSAIENPAVSCSTRRVTDSPAPRIPNPHTPAAATSGQRATFLVAGVLAVVALAAYQNTLLAPFVLDDGGSITDNPTIRGSFWRALRPPGGGVTVSGRPLLNLSLALNHHLSGEAVWSYHALNLLIHFLAACTLFGLVRRTLALPRLRARFGAAQDWLAAAVAGLWLLHPLQTEAVTYVIQRDESMMGLFYLLTFYAFVRYAGPTAGVAAADPAGAGGASTGGSPRPRVGWAVAGVGACLLGVATKEVTATAPLLVFLYDRTFVAGSFRAAWRRRRRLHLALAATWVPLALLVASTGWTRGGTAGFDVGASATGYWFTQFAAIVRYLRQSIWPHPLIFEYGTFWMGLRDALPYAAVVLPVLAATLVALRRWPVVGFLGAWFFVILAPTSVVPGTIQMIVEHRMYLPLAAIIALAVGGAYAVAGRRSLLVWPVLAVALGLLTFTRNHTYRSDLALWRDTVAKVPANARARYNLGIADSERGRFADAVAEGTAVLRGDTAGNYANKDQLFENKLGYDLTRLGRFADAVPHFERALRLHPEYAVAHLNLARALVHLGRYGEAIPHYEAALRRGLGGAPAEAELGDALLHAGRLAPAVACLRDVIRRAPRVAPAYNNLGYALLLSGQAAAAVPVYREATRLAPDYPAAWIGLAYALIQAGRPADAVAPGRAAVQLQPGSADACNTLGIAYAQSGRPRQAVACFEQALRLNGGAADVHNNLGNALAAVGRDREAMVQYREALRLDPDYAPAQRNLGEALQRAGRTAEAAEHLAAAARLEREAASAPGP